METIGHPGPTQLLPRIGDDEEVIAAVVAPLRRLHGDFEAFLDHRGIDWTRQIEPLADGAGVNWKTPRAPSLPSKVLMWLRGLPPGARHSQILGVALAAFIRAVRKPFCF